MNTTLQSRIASSVGCEIRCAHRCARDDQTTANFSQLYPKSEIRKPLRFLSSQQLREHDCGLKIRSSQLTPEWDYCWISAKYLSDAAETSGRKLRASLGISVR